MQGNLSALVHTIGYFRLGYFLRIYLSSVSNTRGHEDTAFQIPIDVLAIIIVEIAEVSFFLLLLCCNFAKHQYCE